MPLIPYPLLLIMATTRRLFVAILLPEEIREAVARVQIRLRDVMEEEGIRWTAPEQFHFTLKFLGDVEESDLLSVIEGVGQASARSTLWALDVARLGVFPKQRNPQILWVGATGGVPVLQETAQYINEELAKRGFEAETKPYIPHITLARMKTRAGEEMVAKNLPMLQAEPELRETLGTFLVQECALMQSELRPGGAVYTAVKTFAFGTNSEYNR